MPPGLWKMPNSVKSHYLSLGFSGQLQHIQPQGQGQNFFWAKLQFTGAQVCKIHMASGLMKGYCHPGSHTGATDQSPGGC